LFFAGLSCIGETQAQPYVRKSDVTPPIKKPATPAFTAKIFDSSYDIPPTATFNTFTGQTETQPGSHIDAITLELRIKNEPFTSYTGTTESGSSWNVHFSYYIRLKGHYDQNWGEDTCNVDKLLTRNDGAETVCSFQGVYSSTENMELRGDGWIFTFPPGAEIDFQVRAMIGYIGRVVEGGMAPWYFFGEVSDWSTTQTVTIPKSSNESPNQPDTMPSSPDTSSQSPSHELTIAGLNLVDFSLGVVVGVIITGLSIALICEKRKNARYKRDTQPQTDI